MINPSPTNIVYCYGQYQPLYDEMKRTVSNINFIEGLPDDVNSYFDPRQHSLLVIDDLSQELTDSIQLVNLFTKGSHHLNLSVIFICQNMFLQGKFTRTMSLNTHYFVVFRNARDKTLYVIHGLEFNLDLETHTRRKRFCGTETNAMHCSPIL